MNISILGCGQFGIGLANCFLDKEENKIMMWNKFEDEIVDLSQKYLSISFTTDLEVAIKGTDLIVIAIPINFLEETILSLKSFYHGQDILIGTKGIDEKRKMFAFEIVNNCLDDASIGVISGGTFAQDMYDKKVMGLTLATQNNLIINKVKTGMNSNFLKIQYSNDIIGVSICGALKNIMAIGFGMLDGLGYPPSSKFLFLTEAIYEINNFIKFLGGTSYTIMSYAGIDDIMMTCTSSQSRNYTLGKLIGKKTSIDEIIKYKNEYTIEGLGTSKAIYELAITKNITLPICFTIYKILYENSDIQELIYLLKKRDS